MRMEWTEQEREEHDALLAEAWEAGEATRMRVDRLLSGVLDGVQAHRRWAIDVEREALRLGLGELLKKWAKQQRQVDHRRGERVVSRPAVVGTRRADATGVEIAVQLELDLLTREELVGKANDYERAIATYSDNRAIVRSLIDLLDAAPEARNAREAARMLDTTVEAWLMGDAA